MTDLTLCEYIKWCSVAETITHTFQQMHEYTVHTVSEQFDGQQSRIQDLGLRGL